MGCLDFFLISSIGTGLGIIRILLLTALLMCLYNSSFIARLVTIVASECSAALIAIRLIAHPLIDSFPFRLGNSILGCRNTTLGLCLLIFLAKLRMIFALNKVENTTSGFSLLICFISLNNDFRVTCLSLKFRSISFISESNK